MSTNKRVAVIGAGPAGLTAAYQLTKMGVSVDVYESSNSVGGMAKTVELWGQLVDLGPHRFFSKDPRVNSLWLEVAGKDYSLVSRLTRIYYKETFFDYPIKPMNALRGLGLRESILCITSYFVAKIKPDHISKTFESWVTNRFGKRLFEIFFKSYSEKLWGISCKELDSDFASQRIKKLSLFEAIKVAIIGDIKKQHKTLVDEFAYPHRGTGSIYNRMADSIENSGGNLILNMRVQSVTPKNHNSPASIQLHTGEKFEYDHIISTMPITHLVQQLNAPKEIVKHTKRLTFRNTILVYLLLEGNSPFPDQWIYVHSNALKTGRITNFKNWGGTINNGLRDTILCLEYWCYDDENIWMDSDETLVALATDEIYKTSLVRNKSIKKGHVIRIPKCYPVYSAGYKNNLKPVEEFLSQQDGLCVIGRYGAFKYNNQDHSILMGILAAENIGNNQNYNLWDLNTDYEYQESSKISATGLTSDG
jgi:protoporphyrinogen oxidase